MKTKLYYGIAHGKNPVTKEPVKRPYLTNRQVYDSEGVIDHAIKLGHIRGKKHDLVGVLNGAIATVRELIMMGYVVDLDGWLLFFLALTGQVGDDLALTKDNELRFRVRALKDLQVSTSDFSFERIDGSGVIIKIDNLSSPNGKKGEIIKSKAIVANGNNIVYNAAWGDKVTVNWMDGEEAKSLELTPSEQSAAYLRFEWPEGLNDLEAGTELTFKFALHGEEGQGEQTSSKVAKLTA